MPGIVTLQNHIYERLPVESVQFVGRMDCSASAELLVPRSRHDAGSNLTFSAREFMAAKNSPA
jgi:hypothetical protein